MTIDVGLLEAWNERQVHRSLLYRYQWRHGRVVSAGYVDEKMPLVGKPQQVADAQAAVGDLSVSRMISPGRHRRMRGPQLPAPRVTYSVMPSTS